MNLRLITWPVLLTYAFVFFLACNRNNDPVPITKNSEHFILITDTKLSSEAEINAVLNKAEILYDRILAVLGEEHRPQNKITIRLEGDFIVKGPYFDNLGIHLFRYSPEENGYLSLLAHEMVHAFHEDYYIEYDPYRWENYPYLDEGVAEYVAQLVDPTKTGFPWYGHDEFAVVGDLIQSDHSIPHPILRELHFEINDRCNLQAYVERSTWIRYIDETYGRDALLMLYYPETAPTDELFIKILGVDMATIDLAWESWVIEKYNNTPGADDIAASFRERTSWYTYCEF